MLNKNFTIKGFGNLKMSIKRDSDDKNIKKNLMLK